MAENSPYRPIEPIYKVLASLVVAYHRCAKTPETHAEWRDTHEERIQQIVADFLPSGSGWDHGSKIDLDASTDERLVFYGSYHHIDESGFYDGWTDHRITAKASLWADILIGISGRNRNDIKEYLSECFDCALRAKIQYSDDAGRYIGAE